MTRTIIQTDDAPAAVGPYSQGVTTGNLVYTAGQIGLIPGTKTLRQGVSEQTRQVIENLRAILEAAGTSLGQVVKTTVFLADMNDFAAMNAVYGEFFVDAPPARSTIQVAALPMGGLVEIECVAEKA